MWQIQMYSKGEGEQNVICERCHFPYLEGGGQKSQTKMEQWWLTLGNVEMYFEQ